MNYYIDSFVKAVSEVSQQVKVNCFELSEEELQKVVEASRNAKLLLLDNCNIHCSKTLKFSNQCSYNTQYLGFNKCGAEGRNSDWIDNPLLFENIVKAISKCGLKESLKTVNIVDCRLDKSNVEKMFKKYGLADISVEGDKYDSKQNDKSKSDKPKKAKRFEDIFSSDDES